jgi:6-phosphogluconolactonase (cycloisomerase 2 family)
VDPSGKFVYKSNTEDDSVAAFAINSSGALIPIAGSPFAVSRPFGLALDPVGHFLFVSGWNPNWRSGAPKGSVSVFTVNSGTGGLTPATGSLLPVKSTPPSRVAVDPSGKFAYVTDSGSGGLMVFAIDESTGAFRQSGWFATGHRPQSVVISGLDE